MSLRVVVIGAGVLGAAVAAGLTRRGAEVTVLEASHPGAGTTSTSFAWVNSASKEPESYFALNHAGVRAHHELAGKHSAPAGNRWFFPTGNLEWAVTDEHRSALAARVDRLRARDYPATWLTAAEARALEPDIISAPDADHAFFPEEAHVLPALLLGRLLGEARDRGARVRHRAEVIDMKGGSVRTADGHEHAADVVVSCVGRWTEGMARLAGAHVPMLDPDAADPVTAGLLTTTAPLAARLSRILSTPRLKVRPDGGGRLLLQALDLDGNADPAVPVAPDGPLASTIVDRLPEVLASTEGAVVEKVRVGQRAMPADGRTVAGYVDGDARFYVVATHSGITLAPLLADLVAEEVHGTRSPMLTGFRPDRFVTGAVFPAPRPPRLPGEQ